MATVTAKLTFGFEAPPYYITSLDDYRDTVKGIVKAEIDGGILPATQIAILSTPFVVPEIPEGETERPSTPEDDVHAKIQEVLDTLPGGFLAGTLQRIVYVWEGGLRYCEHSYYLSRDGDPWSTFDHLGVANYPILARLRWH